MCAVKMQCLAIILYQIYFDFSDSVHQLVLVDNKGSRRIFSYEISTENVFQFSEMNNFENVEGSSLNYLQKRKVFWLFYLRRLQVFEIKGL